MGFKLREFNKRWWGVKTGSVDWTESQEVVQVEVQGEEVLHAEWDACSLQLWEVGCIENERAVTIGVWNLRRVETKIIRQKLKRLRVLTVNVSPIWNEFKKLDWQWTGTSLF